MSDQGVSYCKGIIYLKDLDIAVDVSFTSSNEAPKWKGFTCHPPYRMLGVSFIITCLKCNQDIIKYETPENYCSVCAIARI
jgi:hypothetical protein